MIPYYNWEICDSAKWLMKSVLKMNKNLNLINNYTEILRWYNFVIDLNIEIPAMTMIRASRDRNDEYTLNLTVNQFLFYRSIMLNNPVQNL